MRVQECRAALSRASADRRSHRGSGILTDSGAPSRALMIFHDDSSLAVARAFADLLAERGTAVSFMRFVARPGMPDKLSERQLDQGLGGWRIDRTAIGLQACDEAYLGRFSLVASAKFPVLYRKLWSARGWRFAGNRPLFLALFPGLELTHGRGYEIRRHADILCLPTRRDLDDYARRALPGRPAGQATLRLHPRLLRREPTKRPSPRRLVFFTQSISPATLAGRLDVARLLVDIARAHPDVEVVVKRRHRRDENLNHTHIEQHDYETLLGRIGRPGNVAISDESADSALDRAGMALTCSSTSGVEALAHGVPTMFYLDYAEAAADPLNAPMRALLAGGGPLATRLQALDLSPPCPTPAWLDEMLSNATDVDAVIEAAARKHGAATPLRGSRIGRTWVELDAAASRILSG